MSQNLRGLCFSCVVALALVPACDGLALSQTNNPPARPETAAPSPAGTPDVMAPGSADVEGFRSAKFGMNAEQVKAAIERDFKIKGSAVKEQPNPAERTTVLTVSVPDLLPGGGVAQVSYVFGYESKKLIQVSISWSKATDDKMTPEQLFTDSTILRENFLAEGFEPTTIASNMPISNGILDFRGSDAKGHTVMLMLQGAMSEGKDKQKILKPTALLLFYIADAKSPDIYRLPPGSF